MLLLERIKGKRLEVEGRMKKGKGSGSSKKTKKHVLLGVPSKLAEIKSWLKTGSFRTTQRQGYLSKYDIFY